MKSPLIAPGLALAVALLMVVATARADETAKKMKELAGRISDTLRKEEQTEVSIDVFTETGGASSSAGPMIQSRLMEELKYLKVGINPLANYRVTGDFYPDEDTDKDHLSIKLECRLRTKKGKSITTYSTTLGYKNNEDLVKLLALSVDLTEYAKATPEDRNEHLKKQKEEPPAYTEDDKIKVRKDSPFAVEILAAKADSKDAAFEHRPGRIEKGYTQVSLHKGEEYRVKLCNASKYEIAVTITIDGADAFEFFEPAKGKPTSFLVAPGKERVIKGWKVSTSEDRAFLVGSLGESAAAKLYKPSHVVGTITVCIHPAWEQGKTPPEYDGGKDVGTGVGRSIPEKTNVVPREIGPLLEAISIRYKK